MYAKNHQPLYMIYQILLKNNTIQGITMGYAQGVLYEEVQCMTGKNNNEDRDLSTMENNDLFTNAKLIQVQFSMLLPHDRIWLQ